MRKLGFIISILICSVFFASAQNEGNIWYFGENAGLDFNSGSPVALTNGMLNTIEGCATISDDNGDLLFYTDGITVYNKNHTIMPNGYGLQGNPSSTQSGVIVKKPGNTSNTIYYIFTVDSDWSGNYFGMCYSEVDMSLNGGLGDVIASSKNTVVVSPTCEKICVIKHQNGNEYWIITHLPGSVDFHSYLLTPTGMNLSPVVSSVGVFISAFSDSDQMGYLKSSQSGSLIANGSYQTNLVQVFNFDNSTGTLSNPIDLTGFSGGDSYGVEFSPDNNLLYVSDFYGGGIYQFNMLAGTPVDINNSKILLGLTSQPGAIQLAPDGKIYIAEWENFYLGVIDNPNVIGSGCNYNASSFYLGGAMSYAGLPTFYGSIFCSPTSNITTVSECASYTWPINGTTYTISGSYTDVSTNSAGCIHTETLNLSINNFTSNTTTLTECDNYTWPINGTTYTTSGSYTDVSTNSAGCIHTETLNLTINNSTSNTTTLTECDNYTWPINGTTYTTSGSYTDVSTNSAGCIHTETLNLTINNSTSNTTTLTECDNYSWPINGTTYTTSGSYTDVSTNSAGCTHTETLNLSVNYSVNTLDSVNTCENIYVWNGQSYMVSGTYSNVFTNTSGCDSVANLVLSIFPKPVSDFTFQQINICNQTIDFNNTSNNFTNSFWSFGDSYYSYDMNPDHRYNSPNEYLVTLFVSGNGIGCIDSVSYFVNPVNENIIIFMPNSFTPNDDLLNEQFKIYANFIQDYELHIYNRWGDIIFYSNDINNGWDGYYKGKMCTNGIYTWKLIYSCGEYLQKRIGIVTLIR